MSNDNNLFYGNGNVEVVKVKDIVESLTTGLNPRKNFVLNSYGSECPYITGKDIYDGKVNVSERTDRITKDEVCLINKRAKLQDDVILFASTGTGTVGRMAYIEKYDGTWNVSETLYIIKLSPRIQPKFFMYYIESEAAKKQYEPKISKGSVPHLKIADLMNVSIPVPSLEEQSRIVHLMDELNDATYKLIASLQEEHQLRGQQFEYYREHILADCKDATWMPLFSVASSGTGLTYKPGDVSAEGTLVLRSSNIQNSRLSFEDNVYVNMDKIPERAYVKSGDILICVRNGSKALIGKAAMIPELERPMAFGAFMTILRPNELIDGKFLFFVWQSALIQDMLHSDSGMPINQITKKMLEQISIPVPPIEHQKRIVRILEKYDDINMKMLNDLLVEIDARQKQYEYYRDKLMTFKEAV